MNKLHDYSKVLLYPFEQNHQAFLITVKTMSESYNDSNLSMFFTLIKDLKIDDLQDLYTETFDLDPFCNLNIGHYLYKEDPFRRGLFMAILKEFQDRNPNHLENELPDYLPNILSLIPTLNDLDKQIDLFQESIIPALEFMTDTFKNQGHPYRFLILSLLTYSQKFAEKLMTMKEGALC